MAGLRGPGAFLPETAALFTLELRGQRLLVLLVLQRHRLGPPQLFVHLVGHHPPVEDAADHGEHQQTLEEPPLPPGAHPVPHVGPAPFPAVCAGKPRLCCAGNFRANFPRPSEGWKTSSRHSRSIPTWKRCLGRDWR